MMRRENQKQNDKKTKSDGFQNSILYLVLLKKNPHLDFCGPVMWFACDDDGISGLRCHIAVAVSITWIALHSIYVLQSYGDPHFVFGEENGPFPFW